MAPKTSTPRFAPSGGLVGLNGKCQKLRNSGKKLLGRPDFPPKSALAPGNCIFVFPAQARNFSKCPRPKRGRNTTKSPFPTGGGPAEKEFLPKKVVENHPGQRGNIFFLRFRDPCCSGAQKGPCGVACLLAACWLACCLLARRASSTLVP